jgi:hypothetical protein
MTSYRAANGAVRWPWSEIFRTNLRQGVAHICCIQQVYALHNTTARWKRSGPHFSVPEPD